MALLAFLVEALLSMHEWGALFPLAVAAFGASAWLIRIAGPYGIWPALLLAYLHPVMFLALRGVGRPAYSVVWYGAMLGALLAQGRWSRWSLPSPWKLPVIAWGLIIAVSWPIVAAREAGFDPLLLDNFRTASSGSGGPVPIVLIWLSSWTLSYLIGVLFFDWCFANFPEGQSRRFATVVAVPLCVGGVLGSALATYQGAVDISFWSGHQWPLHGRAAGGLVDGDAFGALAAFWSAASFGLVGSFGPVISALGLVGVVAHWLGLWASASRMALVAGIVGIAGVVVAAVTSRRPLRFIRAFVLGVVVLAIASPLILKFETANPLERVRASIPVMERQAIADFARTQLFNRGAPFGTASLQMVERFPLSGIGLASFPIIFPDYSYNLTRLRASQENAQSWYRQQLAEFGILGSLAPAVFVALCVLMIGRAYVRRLGVAACAPGAALVAMGLACLVSLPTQHRSVAFTVWVLVFWLTIANPPLPVGARIRRWLEPTSVKWWVIWGVTAVFVASTLQSALGRLSVPARAAEADWTYSVGFHDEEVSADGRPFRWTEHRAVEVFPTSGPWLRFAIGGGRPDLADRPQRLRVWRNDKLIIDVTRTEPTGAAWYVGVPSIGQRLKIRIEVDRVWESPSGSRTFGVAVRPWTFISAPPANAQVIP